VEDMSSVLVVRKSNLMKKEKIDQWMRFARKLDNMSSHYNPGVEKRAKKGFLKGKRRTKVASDETLRQEIPSVSEEKKEGEIKKDETL
jgi:hypothetical protein